MKKNKAFTEDFTADMRAESIIWETSIGAFARRCAGPRAYQVRR